MTPASLVNAADGSVSVRLRRGTLFVSPLLRFLGRSPDGCWTLLVPERLRDESEPRLIGETQGVPGSPRHWRYEIPGLGAAELWVDASSDGRGASIQALTRLDQPVHSHLNSFCDIEVRGHRRLSLAFSPCPEIRVEVRRFDYPVGRPSRFAYVDCGRRFRVVEASSGEKGPFRVLAEGRLERTEPLTITLHDEEWEVGRVTLHEWAAQAGTELSPTAGWGVPVNAIEFSLGGDGPFSPASLFVTLAATSVGRGWDCVTHPAGTYRNRITIEATDLK
jgi:hypothetical protein